MNNMNDEDIDTKKHTHTDACVAIHETHSKLQ